VRVSLELHVKLCSLCTVAFTFLLIDIIDVVADLRMHCLDIHSVIFPAFQFFVLISTTGFKGVLLIPSHYLFSQ
jgi:uncharacterized protein (DUF2126 family)